MKSKNIAVFILAVAIVIVVYISIVVHINTNNQTDIQVRTSSNSSSTIAKMTTTAPAGSVGSVDTKTNRITTTSKKEYRPVNINKASAKEISDCLLIDMSLARQIIDLRNKISYFSNLNELFYIDDFPKEVYDTRKDFIII